MLFLPSDSIFRLSTNDAHCQLTRLRLCWSFKLSINFNIFFLLRYITKQIIWYKALFIFTYLNFMLVRINIPPIQKRNIQHVFYLRPNAEYSTRPADCNEIPKYTLFISYWKWTQYMCKFLKIKFNKETDCVCILSAWRLVILSMLLVDNDSLLYSKATYVSF